MPSEYKIEFAPRVEKQLNIIPKDIRNKIFKRIDNLKNNPHPQNVELLHGEDGVYRIRQGDYRIVYAVHDKFLIVLVVRVVHRKEVYQKKHRTIRNYSRPRS